MSLDCRDHSIEALPTAPKIVLLIQMERIGHRASRLASINTKTIPPGLLTKPASSLLERLGVGQDMCAVGIGQVVCTTNSVIVILASAEVPASDPTS
jgi:hypothetical protein